MNIRKPASMAAVSLVMAFSLTGCFLLPKEAEIPALPLITSQVEEDYKTVTVQRGDLALTASVSFSSVSLKEEDLAFTVSGEKYGGIYVSVGDHVAAGDLIAELNNSAYDMEIAAIDEKLTQLGIELEIAGDSLALAKELKAKTGEDISEYEVKVTGLEDDIYLLNLRRGELEDKKDGRRLYASIDGTVTYVKNITDSSTTIKNSAVATVANREKSVFGAFTEFYSSFKVGDLVDITVGETTYTAKVTAPAALGFESESREEKGVYKERVYLVLTDEDVFFDSGSVRGDVNLLLDSREDALWLPNNAIVKIGGKSMVYYQDESGLRSAKEVETGLAADEGVEVVSGLNEGDEIIIGG